MQAHSITVNKPGFLLQLLRVFSIADNYLLVIPRRRPGPNHLIDRGR